MGESRRAVARQVMGGSGVPRKQVMGVGLGATLASLVVETDTP